VSSVDVVIPCYRYAHYLRGCVDSVLSQDGVDVRVLIIDDCSPDDTTAVATALASEDRRVEFRRHEVNRGHIATYNEGLLEWAEADYSLLLSADDLLMPGSLGRATRLMDANPAVVMTHGREIRTADPSRASESVSADSSGRVMSRIEFWELSCREAGNIVSTPSAVVRTNVQKAIGGYRHDLPHAGDMEMWLRFAAHGPIGFIDACQAIYRVHGENMSVGFRGPRDLEQRWAAFEAVFREHGHRLPERSRLERLARQCLAESAFWSGSHLFNRGDLIASAQCHALASRLYPRIRFTPSWWKFRCKWLMGPQLWSRCSPLAARIRGRAPTGVIA
jgi:glycosyltransferase involved in cell wall biosynthesis